ncbi:MAG: LptA/OstA family protein [Rhodospirillales bacterium]
MILIWTSEAALARQPASATTQAMQPGAITIDAEQGIEWRRSARTVTAKGNATAVRGDTTVRADVLTARYREGADGAIEVWQIDGSGALRVTSPRQTALGEKGTYDVAGRKMSISGGKQVSLTTPTSRITADQSIDYDIAGRTLIARGNAVVVDGERTLSGDVITIRFAEGADGQLQPQRIDANGRMRMVTPSETVTADSGTYDVAAQMATASGSVLVVQGASRLNGCRGEMDLRTGVSRMFACPGEDGGRVQGVIMPNALKRN